MVSRNLPEWLEYIERIHPKMIALGLDRVMRVKERLGVSFAGPIITVAGTNGKGSTCAMLESILRSGGYRVGLYSSPHLLAYNERVRLNGTAVGDERLCRAFEQVEAARGEVALTYFEFGTLAAWLIFASEPLDALVLEVGMGGRLDAVNAFDTDCAIVTGVDIDHTEYLGSTREAIGAEKAGIFRRGKPAIVSDLAAPSSVLERAAAIGADLRLAGRDFGWSALGEHWSCWNRDSRVDGLAFPALRGAAQLQNAAASVAALDALRALLPVGPQAVSGGLASVALPARFQVLPGRPAVVLDVAHNPQAAAVLAHNLSEMGFFRDTYAVLGMLRDKDIAAVSRALAGRVSAWYAVSLDGPRGASAAAVAQAIRSAGAGGEVIACDSPRAAYAIARNRAGDDARIVVFGSFYTVADVLAAGSARS
ncbi:MAG: bifunctional tetrahydrofolate synthase/dihydrofolate synthase [Betaproteobacteria bacterium]|nr:bifunctional tetrahydrofolate synthase/dihydrofolate synthase [Betaproteobacteria bacterium]MBI2960614.1 bifunctional tetrahydrofolate synthase/dihydrofolate synthase [Betaproteobacteria bacterium]